MGHRLSKITTRTGDAGETGLGDGSRVPKDAARIQALGDIDELNSVIGTVLAEEIPQAARDALLQVQHDLFDLGGEVCIPGHTMIGTEHVERLEALTETQNAGIPPLKEFILPGGGQAASVCHLARTVARRAERRVVSLARAESVSPEVAQYLNRLSDLLFVLARVLARRERGGEVLWRHERGKS